MDRLVPSIRYVAENPLHPEDPVTAPELVKTRGHAERAWNVRIAESSQPPPSVSHGAEDDRAHDEELERRRAARAAQPEHVTANRPRRRGLQRPEECVLDPQDLVGA